MQFNLVNDVSNFVVQQISSFSCLKRIFCVNKEFNVICRQRIESLSRDLEFKLQEEIRFLLNPTSNPDGLEYSQMILNLALLREYLLNLKRNVLVDVESIYEEQTKSKLGFFERVSNLSLMPEIEVRKILCPISHAILDIIKTRIVLICRGTTDDSEVKRSKVQALVKETRVLLDSNISKVDVVIKGRVEFGQTFYDMHGNDQYKLLTSCMHRILTIMEDRVSIGSRTITQVDFVSEEQMEVRFVKDGGPMKLPFV
jgi:hypothetical protein